LRHLTPKKKRLNKLALIHGNVLTIDKSNLKAQAVLVQDDKIVAVGSDKEITSQIDPDTEVIDLQGRTMLPGFIDCHAHPMYFGLTLTQVDCRTPPAASIRDIIKSIKEVADKKPKAAWIIGNGYDDFKLEEKRHPNRQDLDEAAPNNPVLITRICGHISVANSLALKLGNITRETKDPQGGQIDRDPKTGEPTGVLRETAKSLVSEKIPPPTVKEYREAINNASQQFLARGVTSVTDASIMTAAQAKAYQEAIKKDDMPLRVNLMYAIDLLPQLEKLGISTAFGDDRLKIEAIKMTLDGSMSGRTAAVFQPFKDEPENTGIIYYTQDELDEKVFRAHKAGFQVGIHAIGDRAVSAVLDAYEAATRRMPIQDHRHRIEHCGICSPKIVSRLKELKVIPVPQPIFLYGEGESYRAGLDDERAGWSYPLRAFLQAGIPVPMSSDCPATAGAELISPLLGIYVAVTRKTDEGEAIGPEQKISPEEALRAYTINSAYAGFDESRKGSIEIGKLADFVVLSEDPCLAEPEAIKDIQVELTIVSGKVVYEKKNR
jgi:hypothetical protein